MYVVPHLSNFQEQNSSKYGSCSAVAGSVEEEEDFWVLSIKLALPHLENSDWQSASRPGLLKAEFLVRLQSLDPGDWRKHSFSFFATISP